MKTTFDLPDELVREVKLRAVVQRRTVKDLVAEYLRQGLGMAPLGQTEQPPAGSLVEIGEGGLPFIHCHPSAPSARMSVNELIKLEEKIQAEEDLKHAGLAL